MGASFYQFGTRPELVEGWWYSPFPFERLGRKEPRDPGAIPGPATIMKWNSLEEEKLKELYLSSSLTLEKIANTLRKTPSSISGHLSKLRVKRRLRPIAKIPSRMTPALARTHAHICGDGYMYTYNEKDIYSYWAEYRKKKDRTRYITGYCNNNSNLLREFRDDIYEVFGVRGTLAQKQKIIMSV